MAKQKFDKVAVRAAKSTPENLRSAEQIALLAKFAAAKAASKARKMAVRQQKLATWDNLVGQLDPALRSAILDLAGLGEKAVVDLTPLREQSEQTFDASFILGLVAKRVAALHNRGQEKDDKLSSKYFDVTIVDKDGNAVDGLKFKVVKAEDVDEDEDEESEDEESEDED